VDCNISIHFREGVMKENSELQEMKLSVSCICVCLVLCVGKSKCMMKTGDCVIKHPGVFTTGLKLVVSDQSLHYIHSIICSQQY